MDIRRYLIKERELPRESLTLMGYWRAGRVFD
jgi:NADPH-dependent ferric siderophore reductase